MRKRNLKNQIMKRENLNMKKMKNKNLKRLLTMLMTVGNLFLCLSNVVLATETNGTFGSQPLEVINNLSEFIFGIIRVVGMIVTGFGVLQLGLSINSHDSTQRSNGFLAIAGGVVIIFTKEIINLITGA